MIYIDSNLCTGCGKCIRMCPDGLEIRDEKAVIINENAGGIEGAAAACPAGAIISDTSASNRQINNSTGGGVRKVLNNFLNRPESGNNSGTGRGLGRGKGRGMGRGPRDGSGGGTGGGGRR